MKVSIRNIYTTAATLVEHRFHHFILLIWEQLACKCE